MERPTHRVYGTSSPQSPGRLSWRDIERHMERSRDLRAATLAALLAGGLQRVRRALSHSPLRWRSAALGITMMIGSTTAAGLIASDNAAFAQEVRPTTLHPDASAGDGALLAAIGLELKAIETCEDVDLLWRAVRELVLPGRVAEATQQRILRRVWIVDPDIRHGSFTDSQTY